MRGMHGSHLLRRLLLLRVAIPKSEVGSVTPQEHRALASLPAGDRTRMVRTARHLREACRGVNDVAHVL